MYCERKKAGLDLLLNFLIKQVSARRLSFQLPHVSSRLWNQYKPRISSIQILCGGQIQCAFQQHNGLLAQGTSRRAETQLHLGLVQIGMLKDFEAKEGDSIWLVM